MRTPLGATGLTSKVPNGAGAERWLRAVLAAIVLAASLAGPREARCACRETAPGDAAARVRWVGAGAPEDAVGLDRWCAAVGGPLLMGPEAPPASASVVEGLAVVVWNMHVGNAAEHREDRGNAILSTLPLADPVAIELPYERQRRVAVSARISIPLRKGKPAPFRLVSTHLDNASRAARFWRSFGAGRARQARALLEALDGEEAVVLGGDFNTWFGESGEQAIVLLRGRFPWPARLPAAVTYSPPWGFPQRQVDYLLLRLPAGWQARYRVASDRRGSDHAPLVGWLSPLAEIDQTGDRTGQDPPVLRPLSSVLQRRARPT